MIERQRWKEPKYTKREINKAAQLVRLAEIPDTERDQALEIIDNWRASHAYPLHVFYMNLRRQAASRPDILVVERLKRLESIIGKVEREPGMQLYRMQDLGGCRMVVPSIEDVYGFSNALINSRIRHELKKTNDYIKEPKTSGYRSLHLVYRFYSDTPGKEVFNRYPMLIELQYRTHLQHIWATAVETLGLFTNQAIKAGQGNDIIKRFFVITSSLIAIQEGCNVVPETSEDSQELTDELIKIDEEVHVLETLRAIRMALYHENDKIPNKQGYYLLQLDYGRHRLRVKYFRPSAYERANMLYDKYEKEAEGNNMDVVLVRAASFSTVKEAYPNYFMDIAEFIHIIESYIGKH